MSTPTLTINEKGLILKIGKKVNDCVNVFTEFNPIRNLKLVDLIDQSEVVVDVYNVAAYTPTTGGLAIKLKPKTDESDLKKAIEEILKTM